jgi:hypothetical protein
MDSSPENETRHERQCAAPELCRAGASLHRPGAVRVTQPPACVVLSRERSLAVRGERRRTTRRERDPAARGRECFTGPDSGERRVGDLTRTVPGGRGCACASVRRPGTVRVCPEPRLRARLSGAPCASATLSCGERRIRCCFITSSRATSEWHSDLLNI